MVAIVSLLAAIVLVNLNRARVQARDDKRMKDLRALATAMELYVDRFGQIPPGEAWCDSSRGRTGAECSGSCETCTGTTWTGTNLQSLVNAGLISALPVDPVNGSLGGINYYYAYEPQDSTQVTCGWNGAGQTGSISCQSRKCWEFVARLESTGEFFRVCGQE